ncbi:unnamed protein product [Gongylonema pulchrum]|uniref:Uncharacterized protein n=1 Tax=Gongylonema pulchrum TaxID=637853 RepID=A0A183ESM8_9BILA|nr:unnamed protein product [Gongylonema pulchrum]
MERRGQKICLCFHGNFVCSSFIILQNQEETEMWQRAKEKLPDANNEEYINRGRDGIGEFLP